MENHHMEKHHMENHYIEKHHIEKHHMKNHCMKVRTWNVYRPVILFAFAVIISLFAGRAGVESSAAGRSPRLNASKLNIRAGKTY